MHGDRQHPASFNTRITVHVTIRYLLYLPPGYHSTRSTWPLVLFLHGAGERGSDLDLVKKHGPPMLVAKGKEFPFLLVSPQCPHDAYWSVHVLERLIDNIESRYRIDKSHIYVTGLSLGGLGTWNLGMASPERFAAIAPICGWGDPAAVPALKSVPVWTFHGKKDKIVSIEKTRKLVRALKACGGKVRFTIYPEAGHDAWTVTYNNPAFYRWLLRQRLPHRRITPE